MIIAGAVIGYFFGEGARGAWVGAAAGLGIEAMALLEQFILGVAIQSWRDRHAEAEKLRKQNAALLARLREKEPKIEDDFEDD
jgi:hypothetical protein